MTKTKSYEINQVPIQQQNSSKDRALQRNNQTTKQPSQRRSKTNSSGLCPGCMARRRWRRVRKVGRVIGSIPMAGAIQECLPGGVDCRSKTAAQQLPLSIQLGDGTDLSKLASIQS